ncbi:MAG: 8-oxo-dGTP diphosphatase [Candidatus Paceibacterota bacterium]
MQEKIESIEKLRDVTLVYLVKRLDGKITEICLAMKKRSFGINRWNGSGGKLEEGETLEVGAKREVSEEIGVEIGQTKKVAELSFYFPHKPEWNQTVHVYFCEDWDGEPTESEEMRPQWFSIDELPYDSMWSSDPFWLPDVLDGKLIKAKMIFGEGDVVQEKEINIVDKL